MTTALILVDLQNDFMPGGALAVATGDETVAIANALIPDYKLVVATQDWHPTDHGSFATNHPGAKVFDVVDLNGLDQVLWPVHCVQETHGAAFQAELHADRIDRVFPKGMDPGTDSYSGFFDNGKRRATGMGDWLREQGITEIDVMGLAMDYCVKFTAIDGAGLGFATRLVLPGCRAVNLNPGDDDQAIAAMKAAGVTIQTDLPGLLGS